MAFSISYGHYWDPERKLEILNPGYGDSFTCRGWAPSQGRRCRNPINQANRAAAKSILGKLERMPLDSENLEDELYNLAELCLCVRWHKSQACDVTRQWKGVINQLRRQEEYSRATAVPSPRSIVPASMESGQYSRPPWMPTYSNTITPIADTWRSISRPQPSYPTTNSVRASPRIASNRPTTTQQPESPIQTTITPRRLPISSNRATPTPSSSLPANSASISPLRTPSLPSNAPVIETPSPIRAPPCQRSHVPRRSIDGECTICTLPMTHERLEDLVWCKAECGNSTHRSCSEQWLIDKGTNATCPIW
jgi:hypothetical protein